jgi:hypothetical protein
VSDPRTVPLTSDAWADIDRLTRRLTGDKPAIPAHVSVIENVVCPCNQSWGVGVPGIPAPRCGIHNPPLPSEPQPAAYATNTVTMVVPVSEAVLADTPRLTGFLYPRQQTPEEIDAVIARDKARRAKLAEERATTPEVPLTVERLLDALSITPEFALHLVQPYCNCTLGRDDVFYTCQQADDLNLSN